MDTAHIRRELATSFRLLVTAERRLFGGLAALALVYPVWVAGTGVAVSRVATSVLGEVTVDPWTSQTTAHVGLFVFLWVVLPAGVAAAVAVSELTNLRGNIRQCYRFECPALLLAPPLAGYALGVGAVLVDAPGAPPKYALGLLAVVTVVFVVRTVAFGYRVYALSPPRVLQALLFLAAAAVALAGLSRTARLAGQRSFVEQVAATAGYPGFVDGTTRVAGVAAPTPLFVAVAVPTALAGTYVVAQALAGLLVRVRKPDVPRRAVRAGQRYPQFADRRATAGSTAADSDAAEGADDSDDTANQSARERDGRTAGTSSDTASAEDEDEPVESVGHTRVYTPPGEAGESTGDDAAGSDAPTRKSEMCPICGETFAADPSREHCPNCNAILNNG